MFLCGGTSRASLQEIIKIGIYSGWNTSSISNASNSIALSINFVVDFQMTKDCLKHALYHYKIKRTKGESGLFCRLTFDLHVCHKHLMDSINCVPGGSMWDHKTAGNDQSRSERDHHNASRLPSSESHLLEWSEVCICTNARHSGPYHLARAQGLFNPLNWVEALCWRSSSWCVLPR